ncbi:protein serine/threonine phosphatase 2C [Desarmillaria tabescens]|uniref:Protein serine/threonine phosphatase 2C n=1 Tax=Armillaria tabescens TaxID=1929756 RepID=A0AA39JQA6_ARMTA|nr:protein serine/threonine phosphatase 2C [Desarmillaria tabescens]KAK0446961.1 protein serine/threonine phosphatase 2C [Desarmillaria tabescens]
MSTTSRSLGDWQVLFARMCSSGIIAGIHSVTFQPTPGSTNEDRFVVREWLIEGQSWKFLAVFDGHGGEYTAEYGAGNLPERIERELRKVLSECQNRSRKTLITRINKLLFWRIYYFDSEIVALLNEERDNLWVAGLGDSTVALAFKDEDGLGEGERLLTFHSTHTPKEYCSIVMLHPSSEKDTIMKDDRLLGTLLPTRGLGDHALKFKSIFSTKLFFKLPTETRTQRYLDGAQHYNKTPPYVMNAANTRFIDLAPLRHRKPTLVLFTDGVDIIVDGKTNVDKDLEGLKRSEPAAVVGKLLGNRIDDSYAQETLEHGVEVNWMGENGNRATELLGNLMAGTSTETFAKFLGPAERGEWDEKLYFDDTTILVYGLTSTL